MLRPVAPWAAGASGPAASSARARPGPGRHPYRRVTPMAEINVERKSPGIWPWVIGLAVLALLIWALFALLDGDDEEVAVVDPVATPVETAPLEMPDATMAAAGIPVSEIVQSPAEWTGRSVAGEARVAEVPTDRGFWIEDGGERLFVLLNDAPAERPVDIAPGQTVRLSGAVVHGDLAAVPGEIDADTRAIVQGLPVFLGIDESGVEILPPGGA